MVDTDRRSFLKATAVAAAVSPLTAVEAAAVQADLGLHGEFVELSKLLTGLSETELPANVILVDVSGAEKPLYEIYYDRIRTHYKEELNALLDVWRVARTAPNPEIELSRVVQEPSAKGQKLRIAARQVIKTWYVSSIDDPRSLSNKRTTPQLERGLGQYQHSAIWTLIGAPVPGYSNSTHGYWQAKPFPAQETPAFLNLDTNVPLNLDAEVELPDG